MIVWMGFEHVDDLFLGAYAPAYEDAYEMPAAHSPWWQPIVRDAALGNPSSQLIIPNESVANSSARRSVFRAEPAADSPWWHPVVAVHPKKPSVIEITNIMERFPTINDAKQLANKLVLLKDGRFECMLCSSAPKSPWLRWNCDCHFISCYDCTKKWLAEKLSCPTCRHPFSFKIKLARTQTPTRSLAEPKKTKGETKRRVTVSNDLKRQFPYWNRIIVDQRVHAANNMSKSHHLTASERRWTHKMLESILGYVDWYRKASAYQQHHVDFHMTLNNETNGEYLFKIEALVESMMERLSDPTKRRIVLHE